eukprot:907182-Pelagomonas_calceolata.AAC.3
MASGNLHCVFLGLQSRMMLEKEVDDKEDEVAVFDLKKTSLDNLFYLSYGEWSSVDALVSHLKSDHFMKFAERLIHNDTGNPGKVTGNYHAP